MAVSGVRPGKQKALQWRIKWSMLAGIGSPAVVPGVLLAFSIDAWQEGRQQEYNERVVLRFLLDESTEKRELLAYDVKYNQAILDSATALLEIAAGPQARVGTKTG